MLCAINVFKEEFEDTKELIRIHNSKETQHNGKRKRTKGQTMNYQVLNIKIKTKDRVT